MKRLLLAAGMAVIIHALLLGVQAEWVKTRMARKMVPEPLSISLHYQEPSKKAEVSQMPALTIPVPPEIVPTPPAPKALDAPEIPPFTIPKQTSKKKKTRVERPKPEPQKRKKNVTPQVAAMKDLPEDWMQIPEGPQHQVQEETPAIATIVPVREGAAALPERPKEAAPAPVPPPLVEATPIYRKNPAPGYPRNARRRGYEGKVILEVLVNEEGSVEDLRIFESSGYRVLDRAAMKSVQSWLFEPGRRGDERVEMWVKVPIRFDLK